MEPAATDDVAARYERFATREARHHSEVYEQWAHGVAADADTCALIGSLPASRRQPNLVFACARLHGADPGPYENLRRVLHEQWDAVRSDIMSRSTQTNEAARCGVLLPLFAQVAKGSGRPLALIEAGASAGLCLRPEVWSYRWVDRSGTSLAEIETPDAAGRIDVVVKDADIALPNQMPPIAWRQGIDLNPLDAADPETRAWLRTLVWPGQDERLIRLDAALSRAGGVQILPGDLRDPAVIDAALDQVPVGCLPVVFHTAVLAYLEADERAAFAAQMMRLVREGRCHWVSSEGVGVVGPGSADLTRRFRRMRRAFVVMLDGEPRYQADGHAGWIAG